jgi:hypothetical protein
MAQVYRFHFLADIVEFDIDTALSYAGVAESP